MIYTSTEMGHMLGIWVPEYPELPADGGRLARLFGRFFGWICLAMIGWFRHLMGDLKALARQKGKLWVNYIWISLKIGYPKIWVIILNHDAYPIEMAGGSNKVHHRASFATRSSPGERRHPSGKFKRKILEILEFGPIHMVSCKFLPAEWHRVTLGSTLKICEN